MGAASAGGAGLVSVENSALFNRANSEYLDRTPLSSGSGTTFTFRTLFYATQNTSTKSVLAWASAASGHVGSGFYYNTNQTLTFFFNSNAGSQWQLLPTGTPLFRDNAWYDICWQIDTTQASISNCGTLEINGVNFPLSTQVDGGSYSQNANTHFNSSSFVQNIGRAYGNAGGSIGSYCDGYLAETVMIDGANLSASNFGEFDTTGLYWTPKSSTDIKALTFGTNGFYLDNTTNAQTDASGEGNNFTNNNTVVTSTHTPTNLYTLLSPLALLATGGTLSNGNKTILTGASQYSAAMTTLGVNFGKWYIETRMDASGGAATYQVGIATTFSRGTTDFVGKLNGEINYGSNGSNYIEGSNNTSWGATYTTGDRIGMELDLDAGTPACEFFKNDVSQGTINLPGADGPYYFAVTGYVGDNTNTISVYAEEDDWSYAPSSATFLALNTTNIAEATTRTQSNPYEYWNNILYTGNGTASTDITTSVNPEYLSIKNRSATDNFNIHSVIAGATKHTRWNSPTTAELTNANSVTSFGTGKFTLGTGAGGWNDNGENFVAWAAKLGGTPTADNSGGTTPTSGSVYIDDSISTAATGDSGNLVRLSANTVLGMSVGTFSGTGAVQTVMHGLGVAPGLIIVTRTDIAATVGVYSSAVGNTKGVILNETGAAVTSANFWNNTSPTSAVFTLNTTYNISGGDYQFTAFAPSEYISIGSYEGNANANGTFVPTLNSAGVPLMPIWTLIKAIDSGGKPWVIHDAARDPYNVASHILFAQATTAEGTATSNYIDYVDGGIKIRTSDTQLNIASTLSYLTIGIPTIDVDGRIIAGR